MNEHNAIETLIDDLVRARCNGDTEQEQKLRAVLDVNDIDVIDTPEGIRWKRRPRHEITESAHAEDAQMAEDIYMRISDTVATLNSLLKDAEAVGLPLGVTFPLRANSSEVSIWVYEEKKHGTN